MKRSVTAMLGAVLLLAAQGRSLADGENPSAVPPPAPAAAEVAVPNLSYRTGPEAAAALARAGLYLRLVVERRYPQPYALGTVVQQRPRPSALVARGAGVDVVLMAAQDGPPEGRPPDPAWRRERPGAAPPRPPPAAPAAAVPAPAVPTPAVPAPLAAPALAAPPAPEPPPLPPAVAAPEPGPVEPPPPAVAPSPTPPPAPEPSGPLSGSPDAPAVAERARPGEVPDLGGLALVDAEQRAREAELVLYVDRVPGHPVGRVTTQVPEAGAVRPRGSVVRVTVTAGGDAAGESVPVPAVEVLRVTVPDLLDRSAAQAERILTDLGLALKLEEAQSGYPDRVADQKPGQGVEVAKGSVVTVWVPAGKGRRGTSPTAGPGPAVGARPSGSPGEALDVPAPIAPAEGTVLPKEPALALGFSWLPVKGADAYVLEVEERGPAGWLPSVRKAVRSGATTLELERMAPAAAEVRWRVRALRGGREGAPSEWVTLR